MKNFVCLFLVVFVWCAIMPSVIRMPEESKVAAASENSTDDKFKKESIEVEFFDSTTNNTKTLCLEEYVARALAALTDKDTPMEALKANAVAIRSVVCYRYEHKEHEGYYLCDDPNHCFDIGEVASMEHVKAVMETEGEILTYEGKAALALSHSSSCIRTESYETLYGTNLPYLISVPVWDESVCEGYKSVIVVSYDDFEKAFSDYKVVFDGKTWIGDISFTKGNRVYTIEVGTLCFKGSTFARLFDLPSLCFDIRQTDDGFIINSYGDGNGIGMSRASAALMAKSGKTYKEVLRYFYPDTQLSVIKNA